MAVEAKLAARILFAPFDPTTQEFLAFLESAAHHIDTVVFGWHLPAMTDILVAKHQAGVKVSLLLDHSQAQGKAEKEEIAKLIAAGVPFLIGTSPQHGQIMHSKFTVVDGERVEHGSWNYSLSAGYQSNTVIFHEDAGIAQAFLAHHDQLRSFIVMHQQVYQPQGEVPAAASLDDHLAAVDAAHAGGHAYIHRGHSRGVRVLAAAA